MGYYRDKERASWPHWSHIWHDPQRCNVKYPVVSGSAAISDSYRDLCLRRRWRRVDQAMPPASSRWVENALTCRKAPQTGHRDSPHKSAIGNSVVFSMRSAKHCFLSMLVLEALFFRSLLRFWSGIRKHLKLHASRSLPFQTGAAEETMFGSAFAFHSDQWALVSIVCIGLQIIAVQRARCWWCRHSRRWCRLRWRCGRQNTNYRPMYNWLASLSFDFSPEKASEKQHSLRLCTASWEVHGWSSPSDLIQSGWWFQPPLKMWVRQLGWWHSE